MTGYSGVIDTSFRNIKNIIPKHFDHANAFTRRIILVIDLNLEHGIIWSSLPEYPITPIGSLALI